MLRVDNRHIVSGDVNVIPNDLHQKKSRRRLSAQKILRNQFICWSGLGVIYLFLTARSGDGLKQERIVTKATHLNAHRIVATLLRRSSSLPYRME